MLRELIGHQLIELVNGNRYRLTDLGRFAGDLVGPLFERVGWEPAPGEGEQAYAGTVFPISEVYSSAHLFRQVITLQPTGTNKLFAVAGVTNIKSERNVSIHYSPRDGVLETAEPLAQELQYTVTSTGELPIPEDGPGDAWKNSRIDPEIRKYALLPNVCGTDDAGGPLAEHPLNGDHSFDSQIATNIERHLRTEFKYTLDLTNERMWAN